MISRRGCTPWDVNHYAYDKFFGYASYLDAWENYTLTLAQVTNAWSFIQKPSTVFSFYDPSLRANTSWIMMSIDTKEMSNIMKNFLQTVPPFIIQQ
jgi:hypothetical protein